MTPFPSSQGGGPGRSQPPAVTRKYRKQPRIWGSGRSKRPSRFYGNERRRWPSAWLAGDRAAELRQQEAGEWLGPAPPRGAGAIASAVPAEQGGVCHYRAPTREPRRASGKKSGCRAPPPLPSVSTGNGRNFGGAEETSPRSQSTLYLPS